MLGTREGAALGTKVGPIVGEGVGLSVGWPDGCSDGAPEGGDEGRSVGWSEGREGCEQEKHVRDREAEGSRRRETNPGRSSRREDAIPCEKERVCPK